LNFLAAALASGTSSTSTLANVEPGVLGFLVVAGIGVALVFLLRSMNKQFRKLGPPPGETDAESASGEPVSDQPVSEESASGEPVSGQPAPARPRLAITAGTPVGGTVQADDAGLSGDRVRTGDPKQDARAEGTAQRE
jgi:hypothetical protein